MRTIEDLGVDADKANDDAETVLSDIEEKDIVLILGQLDPMEMQDGEPRWTTEQIEAIEMARTLLTEWENEG